MFAIKETPTITIFIINPILKVILTQDVKFENWNFFSVAVTKINTDNPITAKKQLIINFWTVDNPRTWLIAMDANPNTIKFLTV